MSKRAPGDRSPKTPRQWWVYVIRLDSARLFADGKCASPDTVCVYVGQTAKTPEERFRDHMAGRHASRDVRQYGVRLRRGMTAGPFASEAQARREERRVHNRLKARRNYAVWGDRGQRLSLPKQATEKGGHARDRS